MDVKIEKHDKESYFLQEHIGDGETQDGEKFTVGSNLGSGSLIFRFPEATYTVSVRAVTDAVMAFRKEDGKTTKTEEVIPP